MNLYELAFSMMAGLIFPLHNHPRPDVVEVSKEQLCELFGAEKHCGVLGLYLNDTVYFAGELDIESVRGKSVLLHEYVHHLQFQNRKYTWPGLGRARHCQEYRALEYEAYGIQARYLMNNGDAIMAHQVLRTPKLIQCE